MLCSLLIFFHTITQLLAHDKYQINCTLPPYPKHGFYTVKDHVQPIAPGDKIKSFQLKFSCEDGYSSIGADTMTCSEDGTVLYTDFECLPYCSQSHNLLTCGAELRCIQIPEPPAVMSPYNTKGAASHENYEKCGLSDTVPISRQRPQFILSLSPVVEKDPYVAGGRSVLKDELPWHAGVYTKKTKPYMQICGGTLVSTTVVISAAHCFWSGGQKQLPASDFAVGVGKLFRPWDEPNDKQAQKSDVAEIKIPIYFQGHVTNLQEDIALVIVTSPFTFTKSVRPVCLDFDENMDQKQLATDTLGFVAGWGLTSEDGQSSPVLKTAELPVIDLQECFEKTDPKFRAHITRDKICAGWANGTAVCKGDSGGGFYVPEWSTGDKRFFLRGVVSGAPQSEHLCNVYTWATFTRVFTHEKFIQEALQATSNITASRVQSPDKSSNDDWKIRFPEDE